MHSTSQNSPVISIYVPTERQIDGQIRIYGDSSYKTRAVSLMTLSFAATVIISSGVFRFHQNSASQCVVNVNIYPNLFNSLYLIPQSGISKSIMYYGISPVFLKSRNDLKNTDTVWYENDGFVQERRNSIATGLGLRPSCTNPSKCRLRSQLWPTTDIGAFFADLILIRSNSIYTKLSPTVVHRRCITEHFQQYLNLRQIYSLNP